MNMRLASEILLKNSLPYAAGTTLAVDMLKALPYDERMRAYIDFRTAIQWRDLARQDRRRNGWQWRLDYGKAMRAWRHYAKAVRKARERIMA